MHQKGMDLIGNTWARIPLRKIALTGALMALVSTLSLPGQQSPSDPATRGDGTPPDTLADLSSVSQTAAGQQGSELFSRLVKQNGERAHLLKHYTSTREYELRNAKDQLSARAVVRFEFRAPDIKTFQTVSEEGSVWIRKFVFKRLINSEEEAAAGREHRDSSITPHNYTFRYLGRQDLDGDPCYVVYATPRRMDKYLFEGQVWIDSRDFAVAKIAGHPAKNPSFWIKNVNWVRRYGKVGGFWLPVKDETLTDVRIFGKKKLIINYQNYVVNEPSTAFGEPSANASGDPGAGRD
jgi:hypothetical protein